VQPKGLTEWLAYAEQTHSAEIEFTLDRIREVAEAASLVPSSSDVILGLDPGIQSKQPPGLASYSTRESHQKNSHRAPFNILIAGTNGKGSVAKGLTAVLAQQGVEVGTLTSPHLLRYNERIAINGQNVSDELICHAFEALEPIRDKVNVAITFFEWNVLVALWIFKHENVAVQVLEAGLGGRLDASNIVDADIAVLTSVGLDHQDYLGDTREKIAIEKLGITRAGKPLVCADLNPPGVIASYTREHGVPYYQLGRDFEVPPTLSGKMLPQNEAAIVQVFTLAARAPESRVAACRLDPRVKPEGDVRTWQNTANVQGDNRVVCSLQQLTLPGRQQFISTAPPILLDVAHNEDSVKALYAKIQAYCAEHDIQKVECVFSALADKDLSVMVETLKPVVTRWYIAELVCPRATPIAALEKALKGQVAKAYASIQAAYQAAAQDQSGTTLVVACGSFYVVSAILADCHPRGE
jgi:dihydrofolate synthase/folylpolyglutamate synthase